MASQSGTDNDKYWPNEALPVTRSDLRVPTSSLEVIASAWPAVCLPRRR